MLGTPLYMGSENMGYPIIMRFFKMLGSKNQKNQKIRKKSLIPKITGFGLCDKNSRIQKEKRAKIWQPFVYFCLYLLEFLSHRPNPVISGISDFLRIFWFFGFFDPSILKNLIIMGYPIFSDPMYRGVPKFFSTFFFATVFLH